MTTSLTSERLVFTRVDQIDIRPVTDFFVRNFAHLRPWLPEAEAIARDPSQMIVLRETAQRELVAGREERWFFAHRDEPDRVIGYVFLTRFRRDGHCSCELSYGIDEQHAGRGIMREATLRMLAHARDALGFTRVDARYTVENARSGALLDRLGFERVGVARQHPWLDGAWRDHVLVTRVAR